MAMCALFCLGSCAEPETSLTETDVVPRTTYYSIGDALEYLNDSLNIWYCRPGDEYDETLVFIDTFEVDINGSNEISESDLEALAVEIAETAGDHFYPRGATNKAPFMFEVRQAGIPGGGVVPVVSWFIMEEDDPTSESDEYPYEDPWPYGYGASIGCPTTPNGIDAPDLFRRDLRDALTYGWKNGKGGYAYNRLYTICFEGEGNECNVFEIPFLEADEYLLNLDNPNDPTDDDNFYESPLFFNTTGDPDYHVCLSVNEMNFHFEEMEELAEAELSNENVDGRQIVQVEVGFLQMISGTTQIFHSMQVYYANIITAVGPGIALPSTCCP